MAISFGWLGDLIAQLVQKSGTPKAQYRIWNLVGNGWGVSEDAVNKRLDLSIVPSELMQSFVPFGTHAYIRTTTSNSTPLAVFIRTPANNNVTLYDAWAFAEDQTTGDTAVYHRRELYRRTGGGAPVLEHSQDDWLSEDDASWAFAGTVVVNDVHFRVTGDAANSVKWFASLSEVTLV